MRYSFYVGSTPQFDAHISTRAIDAFPRELWPSLFLHKECVYGEWEGKREETVILTAEFDSDAIAQRIAYAVAILTGNDCVMVLRRALLTEGIKAMDSIARYTATREFTNTGNRTFFNHESEGERFTPDIRGEYVAYLVHADATVTPIS